MGLICKLLANSEVPIFQNRLHLTQDSPCVERGRGRKGPGEKTVFNPCNLQQIFLRGRSR